MPATRRTRLLPLCLATACADSEARDPAGSHETWTVAKSPYLIVEDVTVPEGSTLTIEPGVTLDFAGKFSVIVEGQLIARGTQDEPISFRLVETTGGAEHWGSVVFRDTSVDAQFENLDDYASGSIVEHCAFEGASRAIRISAASPYIHASVFSDNVTEGGENLDGGAAIYVEKGGAPRIVGSKFEGNDARLFNYGGAIYVDSSNPIIQDNTFSKNEGSYGGAIATDLMASPIVGNLFEENSTPSEGGAISLVSSSSALINNRVLRNRATMDGGGIHVCVTCYPHSNPLLLDNTITHNVSAATADHEGAGGVGAAYLRRMAYNNIHDNVRGGGSRSDFGWFHRLDEGYPTWVANPSIDKNWWGTTQTGTIARAIYDGRDEADLGTVEFEPVLTEPVSDPTPRVTITTRKIRYVDAGDSMPVFLTLYNPGAARRLKLVVEHKRGTTAATAYDGTLDFPGAVREASGYVLAMPENAAYFTTLVAPTLAADATASDDTWSATIQDPDSGASIGDPSEARYEIRPGGG